MSEQDQVQIVEVPWWSRMITATAIQGGLITAAAPTQSDLEAIGVLDLRTGKQVVTNLEG